MTEKLTRRMILGVLLAVPAGLVLGCADQDGGTPALPPSTAPPPSLTGADAKKANAPSGGSSAGGDTNPGASQ